MRTDAENFTKSVQKSCHLGANLWAKFQILTVLGCITTFLHQ